MTPNHMGENVNRKSRVGAGKAVAGNRWELACEVCGMHGWNIVSLFLQAQQPDGRLTKNQ